MHGSEFQLTDKKPRVPAETSLIFCFVRYPRAVVGLLAGPPRAVVGLLAGPAGCSGPTSGCFFKNGVFRIVVQHGFGNKGQ
jgi:hypothetical protein